MAQFPVQIPDPSETNDVWELLFVEECILRAIHKGDDFDTIGAAKRRNKYRNYLLAGITDVTHFRRKSDV
jgi:hypothetical protein